MGETFLLPAMLSDFAVDQNAMDEAQRLRGLRDIVRGHP
jgi:hypothetical protein